MLPRLKDFDTGLLPDVCAGLQHVVLEHWAVQCSDNSNWKLRQ